MARLALAVLVAAAAAAGALVAGQAPPGPVVVQDIMVMDCSGGLHLLPGTPLEFNFNFRSIKRIVDGASAAMLATAACTANASWCVRSA
jgi:hypothetical protein